MKLRTVVGHLIFLAAGTAADPEFLDLLNSTSWPVPSCMRNQDDATFDAFIHPGDGTTELTLPKFWSPPLLPEDEVFPRETAMKIGSCVQPDPTTGSFARGDSCILDQRTIYVTISSYRDFECRTTVESLLSTAQHPERIRLGIVDQRRSGESSSSSLKVDDGDVPCGGSFGCGSYTGASHWPSYVPR